MNLIDLRSEIEIRRRLRRLLKQAGQLEKQGRLEKAKKLRKQFYRIINLPSKL